MRTNLNKIKNIAILAHADAGKTTITEQFLFLSGAIKKAGSVDKGTTQTDNLPVEKERGISVRSSNTSFIWKTHQINLIDTPGHVDFSSEVDKILPVIEGAILIISAVEGVQAHTETIWAALRENNIPCILFINKVDRIGANTDHVLKEIRKELTPNIFIINQCSSEETMDASISTLFQNPVPEQLIEQLSAADDIILDKYLCNQEVSFKEAENSLKNQIVNSAIFPVMMGSAKNQTGIKELLDAVVQYIPTSGGDADKQLQALVYRIEYDKSLGKISHIRIFEGTISNREIIENIHQKTHEKITRIRKLNQGNYEDVQIAKAGEIIAVGGLASAQSGDYLGTAPENIFTKKGLKTPLLSVQIKAENEKDYTALAEAMTELNYEDPALEFKWIREEKELNVRIMGWIQMEVLEKILEDRYGLKAKFQNPTVIYKETPTKISEGFVRYWMPKPCWAILKFLIEPAERGSGVHYESKIGVNDVLQKYQNEVERTIPYSLQQGIKGWEVTDLKITLIEGEDHEMHTKPGDFVIATPMGIMDGLKNCGTTLLEPIISFKISAPEQLLGAVASDITQMRGTFESPEIENGKFVLKGILPVSSSLDYSVKLSSRSGGKAKISTQFYGYQDCSDELGVVRDYKGISPLDTAKYILKARGAMQ